MSYKVPTYSKLEEAYQNHYKSNTFVQSGKMDIKVGGITTGRLGVEQFLMNGGIITYNVQSGDTLSEIAQMFAMSVDKLAKINKIENVNLIQTKQRLTINYFGE
jgi:hypothetical protein